MRTHVTKHQNKIWCDGKHAVCVWSLPEQEKFQFAQETVKAEAWLQAKEPLISSKQEGEEAHAQTDEVEQLILRHEAFRKAAVTWKERFSSLRQLSTVSFNVDKNSVSVMESWLNAALEKMTGILCLLSRHLHICIIFILNQTYEDPMWYSLSLLFMQHCLFTKTYKLKSS